MRLKKQEVIPEFEEYYFCFRKMQVYSMKSERWLAPIKRKNYGEVVFKLYRNGTAKELTIFEILRLILDFRNQKTTVSPPLTR